MRINWRFRAQSVISHEEFDASIVSFSDCEKCPDSYVFFQRSTVEEKEIGCKNELNSYFMEVNSPENSGYGGLEYVKLHREKIDIMLSPSNKDIGYFKNIEITFSIEEQAYSDLKSFLTRIFMDTGCTFSAL